MLESIITILHYNKMWILCLNIENMVCCRV